MERRESHGALRLGPRDLHVLIQQSRKPGPLSDCGSALLLKSHLIESFCELHNLALRYFPQDNRFKEALSSAHLHTWLRSPTNVIDTWRNCKPADSDTDDGPRTAMRLTWLALPLTPEYLLQAYRFRQLALRLQGYVMWDAARLQGSQEFTIQHVDPQMLVSMDENLLPCFYHVEEDDVYTMGFSVKCKKLLAQDGHSGFFNMSLFEITEHEDEADFCRLGYAMQFLGRWTYAYEWLREV
ncbi:uncharacterized protein F5Z01DRAFT_660987 [Emericellopsis atlantica]|uniref:Uncharacterized protein n=1 Tax=Emericellopsis atlantica TaxID=2614577 RepID=A0A9P7ZHL0_9HYPO|nr:uncharacterized protein F5Z01DRAFT_660987 [Emericellopsis atlantica]KAG9252160.1 hypothetical protein F5Z01DRAFT_660987 [Emericellopsis atlantica]